MSPASSASGSVRKGQREASGGPAGPALARGPSRTWGRDPGEDAQGRWCWAGLAADVFPAAPTAGSIRAHGRPPVRSGRGEAFSMAVVWLDDFCAPTARLPLPALCCVLLTVSVPNVRDDWPSDSSVGSGAGPGGGRRRGRPPERGLGGGTDTRPAAQSKRNGDSGRWTLTLLFIRREDPVRLRRRRPSFLRGPRGIRETMEMSTAVLVTGPRVRGRSWGPWPCGGRARSSLRGLESRTLLLLLPFAVVFGVLFCFCFFGKA